MQIGSDASVTGTLASTEAVECAFDSEGAAHLMGILSNMYRNKHEAVLREYAANARDSQIRAGNTAPIEVTLPTEWNPTLKVADQGLGLSRDEIITVYSRYGKSTKRNSNTEVGAFGIGAKSAFTIATQFTVTGVKNGWKTSAVFALNAQGVATVDIVADKPTDEPTGVTVAVPVDDAAMMRRASDRLFRTWPRGSVMVDGEQPASLFDDMLEVNDHLYARSEDSADIAVTVVMGGIAYPASESMLQQVARHSDDRRVLNLVSTLTQRRNRVRLVACAPVGEVDITPSREDLRDTPRTIAFLARVLTEYVTGLDAAIERTLESEPTPMHVSVKLASFLDLAPSLRRKQGVTWRGQYLSMTTTVPHPIITLPVNATRTHSERYAEFWLGENLQTTLAVTGVDDDNEATVRRLARRYMTHHHLTALLLLPGAHGSYGWFSYGGSSPLRSLTFEEFTAASKELPSVTPRRETLYNVLTPTGERTMSCTAIKDAVTAGVRLLLAGPGNYDAEQRRFAREALSASDMLVTLDGTKTEAAFSKRFPTTRSARPILRAHARRTLNGVTEQEKLALEYQRDRGLERISENPQLSELEPLKTLTAEYKTRCRALQAQPEQRIGYLRAAEVELGLEHSAKDVTEQYPLLNAVLRHLRTGGDFDDDLRAHLALYLQAAQTRSEEAV